MQLHSSAFTALLLNDGKHLSPQTERTFEALIGEPLETVATRQIRIMRRCNNRIIIAGIATSVGVLTSLTSLIVIAGLFLLVTIGWKVSVHASIDNICLRRIVEEAEYPLALLVGFQYDWGPERLQQIFGPELCKKLRDRMKPREVLNIVGTLPRL